MTPREQLLGQVRTISFAIAYRMLGSVSEAEDVVQEALLRLHQALEGGERIASARAFVATVTTRLAIDALRSARKRRESYVGEWLPEPLLTDDLEDPARQAEMADSLSVALLVLLESLSPDQRAVLLLHDVFAYGYDEIARIIGKNEDNVRQLATRARRHVEQRRPRFQTSRAQRDELARRFFAAAQAGDLGGLEALLAQDVVLTGDGGGKVPALARSLHGRSRVARTLLTWVRLAARMSGVSLRVEAGGRLAVTAADAANPIVAGQLLDAVRPDVLVLNAGAAPLSRPLHQHTWESFSRNWEGDELWQRAQRDTLLVVVQVLGGRCAPAASAKEQPTCRGSGVQPRGGHPSRALLEDRTQHTPAGALPGQARGVIPWSEASGTL